MGPKEVLVRKKTEYRPPYTITSAILKLVAEIGEAIGSYTVLAEQGLTPRLMDQLLDWLKRTEEHPW